MPARKKVSHEFRDYVLGQLEGCGDVRAKAMFGGTGIYVDEVFCAIVTGSSRFFLRVDDSNRPDFEARGMEPFKGRGTSLMPYFEVPPEVLEDPTELTHWLAKARTAAQSAATQKKPRKR